MSQAVRRGAYAGDGVALSGLEAGPPDGPLVLLLHGFPEDAQSWERQIGALAAAGLRVAALDQRGYGGSDSPRGWRAYHLDRLAADVLAAADGLGRARFDLVGHDWGGVVAWWLAVRHPERVGRLAILNAPHPSAMASYLVRSPTQALRSAYIGFFQAPVLPELLLSGAGFAILTWVLRRSSRPQAFSDADLARLRRGWRVPGGMTARLNWYRALRSKPRSSSTHRVVAPTLVLWGARDGFLERGLAQASAAFCDRAQILYLEDVTHWLQHEKADAVNAALVRFLTAPASAPLKPDAAES